MNIVLKKMDETGKVKEFLIYSIKKNGAYSVVVKKVSGEGRMIETHSEGYLVEKDATRRLSKMVRIKMTKNPDMKRVEIEDLPAPVVKFLEVPPEMQITPEEMVLILRKATSERYVTLIDVTGIEEYFDAGVEYIGFITDDPKIVKVYDRFGKLRDLFDHRIGKMVGTERAIDVLANKVEKKLGIER